MSKYSDIHRRSIENPNEFWAEAAEHLVWERRWDRVLDDSNAPIYRWFTGGRLNTCYNAVDRHVANGRGEQAAIIYDSPITGTGRQITYRELQDQVALFAGALAGNGVGRGDRVILYMPMIPEAIVAVLACARIGAVHSVVFGGFAPNELATRIDDARPKAIVSASCGIEPSDLPWPSLVVLLANPLHPLLVPAAILTGDRNHPCPIAVVAHSDCHLWKKDARPHEKRPS